jgi:hypothetical protein
VDFRVEGRSDEPCVVKKLAVIPGWIAFIHVSTMSKLIVRSEC